MVEINRRVEGRERVHPNTMLNTFVTNYVLEFLTEAEIVSELESKRSYTLREGDGEITKVALDHLSHLEILGKDEKTYKLENSLIPQIDDGVSELVLNMASMQRRVLNDESVSSVRSLIQGNKEARKLVAYAPSCLLLSSYVPLLTNLLKIEKNDIEYGLGKDINRSQPDNSDGAGLMMVNASKRIAEELTAVAVEKRLDNVAVLELGSGNASFLAAVVEEFSESELKLPQVLATDIDPATGTTARDLFDDKDLLDHFDWMQIDMGNAGQIREVSERFQGKQVIVHIGYILHESRYLASETLSSLSESFPEATLAVTEYYNQENITKQVPLWFQTIHELSEQELFSYQELINTVKAFGYKKVSEVVHNALENNNEPLNSTIFFEKN